MKKLDVKFDDGILDSISEIAINHGATRSDVARSAMLIGINEINNSKFPELKKLPRGRPKKLIYGVGINDADFKYDHKMSNGENDMYIFIVWKCMLTRCYSKSYKKAQPTYSECSVCDDWLTFSKFRSWMIGHNFKEKHLDKDIKNKGNNLYSPENCIFVNRIINNLISGNSTGKHMKGTIPCVSGGFYARCSMHGVVKTIGLFSSEAEAHNAYLSEKNKILKEYAKLEGEPARSILMRYEIT